jgi:hypothetical protein
LIWNTLLHLKGADAAAAVAAAFIVWGRRHGPSYFGYPRTHRKLVVGHLHVNYYISFLPLLIAAAAAANQRKEGSWNRMLADHAPTRTYTQTFLRIIFLAVEGNLILLYFLPTFEQGDRNIWTQMLWSFKLI